MPERNSRYGRAYSPAARGAAALNWSGQDEGERQPHFRLLPQAEAEAAPAPEEALAPDAQTLPSLATANDAREAVRYLRKKPAGITPVEAAGTVKKPLFDPRKIAAYEFWGIVTREGERLSLSAFGREFARVLDPEAQLFRRVLDRVGPYRAALAWIGGRGGEVVTHAEVAAFWREHGAGAHEGLDDRALDAGVLSFFHLCHAAGLGLLTIGKRGQPARLRVEREELELFVAGDAAREIRAEQDATDGAGVKAAADSDPSSMRRNGETPRAAAGRLRVGVTVPSGGARLARRIQETIALADVEAEVNEREPGAGAWPGGYGFDRLREYQAGLFVITAEDFGREELLVELGAALALYERRVILLLWDQRASAAVPAGLRELPCCALDGGELTWEAGVQLLRALKKFTA
ncbi:MAG: hypothetical protein ACRD9R_07905 [Pyrinomonadaceae bacterium]